LVKGCADIKANAMVLPRFISYDIDYPFFGYFQAVREHRLTWLEKTPFAESGIT
jgi:hypothetical protein